jgi:hypothetical protein
MSFLDSRLLLVWVLALCACRLAQPTVSQPETDIRGCLSDEGCARGRAEDERRVTRSPRPIQDVPGNASRRARRSCSIDPERRMIFRDRQSAPGKEAHWRLRSNRGPDGLASENSPDRFFKNAGAGNGQLRSPEAQSLARLFQQHSADEVGEFRDLVFTAPCLQFVDNLFGGTRIPITGGANLHRRGSSQHEFDDVCRS